MTYQHRMGYWWGLLAVCCWAGFIVVTRIAGLSALTPYDMLALRFGVGGLLLLPFARRWLLLNLQGVALMLIGGIAYTFTVYRGFQLTSAMHGAILLTGCIPLGSALFSIVLLNDRPTPLRWLGLGLIGVGSGMMLNTASVIGDRTGDFWLIAAVLAWSLYTVLIKRWRIQPLSGAVTVACGTAFFYLPAYLLFLPKQWSHASPPELWLQAGYQGVIATVVAMLLYLRAVSAIGPAAMGAMMALAPVLSTLAAAALLQESTSLQGAMALFLASAGALLASGLLCRKVFMMTSLQ